MRQCDLEAERAAQRHADIMVAWLRGESCKAIGARLNISGARVHQIVVIALGRAGRSVVKFSQRGNQEFINGALAAYWRYFGKEISNEVQ